MFNKLKKFFVPHESNDCHPEIWRQKGALLFLVAIFFIETLFLSNSYLLLHSKKFLAAVFPQALVALTNDVRSESNLQTLTISDVLTKAAQLKADDMAKRQYFSHYTPDGNSPWTFFKEAGYDYSYAGENLAINFVDSKDVVDAWVKSPTHYANIVKNSYTEIGIATADGEYQGKKTIYIVEFFAKPRIPNATLPTGPMIAKGALIPPTEPKATPEVSEASSTPVTAAATTTASTTLAAVEASTTLVTSGEPQVFGLETDGSNDSAAKAQMFFTYPKYINKIVLLSLMGVVLILLFISIRRHNKEHHGKIYTAAIYFIFIISLVIAYNQIITTGMIL